MRSAPSPACGGGLGWGNARHESSIMPPPCPSPASGGGDARAESLALASPDRRAHPRRQRHHRCRRLRLRAADEVEHQPQALEMLANHRPGGTRVALAQCAQKRAMMLKMPRIVKALVLGRD